MVVVEPVGHVAHHRGKSLRQCLVRVFTLRARPNVGNDILDVAEEFFGIALAREEMLDLLVFGYKLLDEHLFVFLKQGLIFLKSLI